MSANEGRSRTHEWLRRPDRSGYDCLRCDAAHEGEFHDDEHARSFGECDGQAPDRVSVSLGDLKLVLGNVRPESHAAGWAYQRLAEAVAHAEGRPAPWVVR